eukprot:2406693-Pyramimonas_sp.AAC.1
MGCFYAKRFGETYEFRFRLHAAPSIIRARWTDSKHVIGHGLRCFSGIFTRPPKHATRPGDCRSWRRAVLVLAPIVDEAED